MIALAFPDDEGRSFDARRFLPLADFLHQQAAPTALKLAGTEQTPTASQVRHAAIAVGHLQRFLGRPPLIADLTSETLDRLTTWLTDRGRKISTVNRVGQELVRLGGLAAANGLLEVRPYHAKRANDARRRAAFAVAELERLLAAASLTQGDVAGLPASDWWPAFLLVMANTGLAAATLFELPLRALDLAAGELKAEGLVYGLHPHTAAALKRVHLAGAERLFPWPGAAKKPTEMALYYARRLFKRAGVPVQKHAAFARLRATLEEHGLAALDRLDVARIERERQALAARRKADQAKRLQQPSPQSLVPRFYHAPKATREVYVIRNDGPRSLRTFLREVYAPRRLAGRKESTLTQYEVALRVAASYTGVDVTLDQLGADYVDGLLTWLVRSGRSPARANAIRAYLLAIWRYAMRKRYLPWSGEPDQVEKLPLPKREPRTWTLAEFERILAAASLAKGKCLEIPTGQLLPAVLLTVYFTGLRIGALLQLRTSDLDLATGWLSVDAEFQKHNADQRFRLPPVCLSAIAATAPETRVMLFGGPPPGSRRRAVDVRASSLRLRLKQVLVGLGLPSGARHLLHKIRRLSATQMVAVAGEAAAQRHLGHSDPTLLRFYVDRAQLTTPDASELLPRLNWTPPAAP